MRDRDRDIAKTRGMRRRLDFGTLRLGRFFAIGAVVDDRRHAHRPGLGNVVDRYLWRREKLIVNFAKHGTRLPLNAP